MKNSVQEKYANTIRKFDDFIELSELNISRQPFFVIMAMHEFFRNIFMADPYIPLENTKELPLDRINIILDNCMIFLRSSEKLGTYFSTDTKILNNLLAKISKEAGIDQTENEGPVQNTYNALWKHFDTGMYIEESAKLVKEKLVSENFSLDQLKDKVVLDMGCGSGRFTIALAQFGAKEVVGIDLGVESINRAKEIATKNSIENVKFQVGSVLDLPFKDNFFDFVFSNGVLHHTENMEKGIQEFYRVLKPGSPGWLFLYGDGGLYWYARKKMPLVMKKIERDYTISVLKIIGMPSNRFIFSDNWYVPFERHTSRKWLEEFLTEVGFSKHEAVASKSSVSFDSLVLSNAPQAKGMWGDGYLRYLVWK